MSRTRNFEEKSADSSQAPFAKDLKSLKVVPGQPSQIVIEAINAEKAEDIKKMLRFVIQHSRLSGGKEAINLKLRIINDNNNKPTSMLIIEGDLQKGLFYLKGNYIDNAIYESKVAELKLPEGEEKKASAFLNSK